MMISRRGGPDAAAPAGGSMMKKAGIACFAAVAILVVYSAIIGIGGGSRNAQGTASAAAVKVTSREFAAAYRADRVAARKLYGMRPLEVTGALVAVQLTSSDEAFLVLEGSDPVLGLKADLAEASRPEAASLSKGQVVTLGCEHVGEAMGAPMLEDCELLAINSAVALASASASADFAAARAPWKAMAAGGQTRIGIST